MSSSYEDNKSLSELSWLFSIPELTDVVVQEKIGSGNFGEVYLGIWLGMRVALKKLKSKEDYADFEREAGTLSTLSHPNVVWFCGVFNSADSEQFIVTGLESMILVLVTSH